MGEWTTLSVRSGTRDRFNDLKSEMDHAQRDCPDLSADQFLQTLMDTLEHAQDGGYDESTPSNGNDIGELKEEIRKAVELAEQARDNTDQIKKRMQ